MKNNETVITLMVPVTMTIKGEFGADSLALLASEASYSTEHTHSRGSALLQVKAPTRQQIRQAVNKKTKQKPSPSPMPKTGGKKAC